MSSAYLVTKQLGGSSPHERRLVSNRDQAALEAVQLSNHRSPTDLSEWDRRQGNQYKPTRWKYWYRTESMHIVNIEILKFILNDGPSEGGGD